MLATYPAPGDEFERALNRVLQGLADLQASLSEREKIVLHIGLRASHGEEALARGETDRAREHFARMAELMRQLKAGG